MKFLKFIFLFLIINHFSFAQNGTIKGEIRDTIKNVGFENAFIEIKELSTGAQTDSDGNFQIRNIPSGEYSIRISALGFLDKEIQEVIIQNDSVTNLNITYPPFCKFYNSKKECPICQKEDKVIPIIYGMPTIKMARKAKRGKLIIAGCELTGCNPNWYCKRDEIEF